MSKLETFVGIDVALATLEIAVRPTGESWQVANDEIAFGVLVDRLRKLAPTLIVLQTLDDQDSC
jgi:transposase